MYKSHEAILKLSRNVNILIRGIGSRSYMYVSRRHRRQILPRAVTHTPFTFQGTVCYLNGWILLVRHEANLSLSRDAHYQVTINMDIKTQQQKEADWPDSMLQTRRQHTCHGVPKLHEEEETWHGFPRQR
jgi:hypothetical protein